MAVFSHFCICIVGATSYLRWFQAYYFHNLSDDTFFGTKEPTHSIQGGFLLAKVHLFTAVYGM